MSLKRIALVSCVDLPEPDPDETLLLQTLKDRGVLAEVHAWDDPLVPWDHMDVAVLRSTWNYSDHHAEFLQWARTTATQTRLWNPINIVEYNSDKHYLLDLQSAGFPVVPTEVITPQDTWPHSPWASGTQWVIKPTISAGSRGTRRFADTEIHQATVHVKKWQQVGDVLIQPYLVSVETVGERAIVVLGGEISHAVRKTVRFDGDSEQVSAAIPVESDEAALVQAILSYVHRVHCGPQAGQRFGSPNVDWKLPYARVDLARDDDGNPVIMELELIEPSLFLKQFAGALHRFADIIVGLI